MESFSSFSLPEFLDKTLKKIGLKQPTPVQAATIPHIMAGRNVVAQSPTGSGKTASFALPMISELSRDPFGIFAVVLSPTRELAEQIAEQFKMFGSGMQISVCQVYGGLPFAPQAASIEKNPHVLIATPGRLLEHLKSSTRFSLQYLRFLVLDEVDRLFNEGFWGDVERIVSYLPSDRQTLLFSATMKAAIPLEKVLTKPESHLVRKPIQETGSGHLSEDGFTYFWRPSQGEMPKIEHLMMPVPAHMREVFLIVLLEDIQKQNEFSQVLVFTNHCETAETVTLILRKLKFKTAMLHSKMEQDDRFQALKDFRAARQKILVATDVAARGLDIPFVDVVIHFNPPPDATIYVHRSGRTGRAGRSGKSILFINSQKDAKIVEQVEKEIGHELGVFEIDEKETIGRIKEIMNAKRDAKMIMSENGFGEREKRLQSIQEARDSIAVQEDDHA